MPEEIVKENEEEINEYEELEGAERELAVKHGFLKKEEDGEHEEQPKPETDEDSDEDQQEKLEEEKEITFEDVEEDESHLKKFNKNEKALYFRWKSDKRKRQEAVEKYKQLEAELELGGVKSKVAQTKIERIKDLLSDQDRELTVKDLMDIIDSDVEIKENRKLSEAEWKEKQREQESQTTINQKQFQERQSNIEVAGKELVDNFDKIAVLANEVVSKNELYKEVLGKAILDFNVSEVDIVNQIVQLAQLNPKFKDLESGKKPEIENSEKAKKVLTNSKKKVSSASIGSGKGKLMNSEENLTVEEASNLSPNEWMKLKKETRERILMGIDP